MLKQRKHSPFDDSSSPDGNHYLRKKIKFDFFPSFSSKSILDNKEDEVDGDEDDEAEGVDEDEDECCSDASDNSQKALVFAD